jgi:hypothetical protein
MDPSQVRGGIAQPTPVCENPESEYVRRLSERQQQLAGSEALHRRLWIYLILALVAGIVIAWVTHSSRSVSAHWIVLPGVVSLSIIQSLTKNARTHGRLQRVVNSYDRGLGRLRNQWQGQGIAGEEFRPEKHEYASDLDLFGAGSLFELLCTARTGIGRAMLANWLLHPAECGEVTERQVAIFELRDRLDLREDWASVEGSAMEQAGSAICEWASAPDFAFPSYVPVLAVALPSCLVGILILAGVGALGQHWVWIAAVLLGLEGLVSAALLQKTRRAAATIVPASFELGLLCPLLRRLEIEHFECALLQSLQSRLKASSGSPAIQIRRLSLWAWLLGLRQIEYFALLTAPLLWGTNFAMLIERWRQHNREDLGRWLDSLARFEALLCLARYYYENSDHTFAILEPQSDSLFEAEALGNPSLDRHTCVRGDIRLSAQGTQLMMVSGSNMSGKSTLLRSVGVNCVLALAGAPVRAARLRISPLRVACSIAVHDSLLQGKSRFQAEVERLKWVLDLSREDRVLFLLDEVLSGTNSNDRLFGAQAVIEQLTENGALGLVTTHDLALSDVVKVFERRAMNVHFEEQYANGEMVFDYQIRPGVLTRTNGAHVMAALGLLRPTKNGEAGCLATPP